MSEDTIQQFLSASTLKRFEMSQNEKYESTLKNYFGEAAFGEYQMLASQVDPDHLGVGSPKNLIFVPGVMGSLLFSKTKGGVWWFDVRNRNHIDDLALSPDGKNDADPTNQIEPFTIDTSYEPFNLAVLAEDDFGHEHFPYDWRKPLSESAADLRDLILKLHQENGGISVHLVAHSMGGLMVRTTLMLHGDEIWPKIGRIVFMGTPHYGSPAMAGYLKNHFWGFDMMALLGRYLTPKTFRSLRGPLNMLPAPTGIYPGTRQNDPNLWTGGSADDPYKHPCANFDMYKVDTWGLELTDEEKTNLQFVLDDAANLYAQMDQAHLALDQEKRDKMLVVAGVGHETLFRLAYKKRFWGLWEHTAKTTQRIEGDPHRDGDGRVPVASAALEYVEVRYVVGEHGSLPNIPKVYEDVFRWLKNEPLKLPDSARAALSSHLSAESTTSLAPHLDGSAFVKSIVGDESSPNLWDSSPVDPIVLDQLQQQFEEGQLPEMAHIKIL